MTPPAVRPEIVRKPDRSGYLVGDDPEPYASVTTIISKTVPKELGWWGMTVGVAGVMWLIETQHLNVDPYGNLRISGFKEPIQGDGQEAVAQVVDLLKAHKLTVNHRMNAAGDRGTLIHDSLERYGKTGEVDDAMPPALARWLIGNRPEFLASEVATASMEHRYAGTFDLRARLHAGKYKGQIGLIDLKTTKRVYPDSHFPQLEAYEQAERELGEPPTDFRAVLHLPHEGEVRLVFSTDTFEDFRVLLEHWRSIERRKGR